ncbi:unnamed protein product [Wickerhamomyces anomalus]
MIELLLIGVIAALTIFIGYKPLKALLVKSSTSTDQKSTSSAGKKKFYDENAPIPEPTPLMITPEQVKTYDDRPWRPFRWPYHQTMSIFKLDVNHWLDMDKYYWHYIQEKERIHHEYGDDNFGWLPEAEDACIELMEMVTQHMLKRYPLLFKSEDGGVHVKNELTGELLDMSRPLKEHPLLYVSKMAKEDFYVVLKRDDGLHYLVAAAVPFPGGSFGIKAKLGRNLDVIHNDVPYYESKLKKSMERWFGKMTASDLVERASWYMSWDHKLLCSNVYALKEGEKVDSSVLPTEFNVRVERQTLRRLPKNIIKYKNFESFRDHIAPYLDGLIKRQIDKGLIKEDTPLKTLPSYPFAQWVEQSDEVKGWNKAMLERSDAAHASKAQQKAT